MAQKLSKSTLLAKQKSLTKGAWKSSRTTEKKVKGQQLPTGLVKAVAKCIDSGFASTKEKGIPYYFVKGEVVEPSEFSGTKFQKMWFLKATVNKSIEDKMNELASDLKLLVGDEREGEIDELEESALPDFIESLKDAGIFFEFNTWAPPADKKNPNPSTFVFIQGRAEGYEEPATEGDEGNEGNDEGSDENEDNGESEEKTTSKPSSKTSSKTTAKAGGKSSKKPSKNEEPEPEAEAEEGEGETEGGDDNGDGGEGDEPAADEDGWEPKPKEVYYHQANPKAKKKEVAVLKVDAKKRTANVKRLEDDKVFNGVSWDALQGEE